MNDRFNSVDGRDLLLTWRIDRHIFVTFEVDTDAAEPLLPEPLTVVEVRPGVSLFSIGLLRYEPGHFGKPDSPQFDEVVCAVHVAPDLSTDMPMPKMNFFATRVYASSEDFVAQEDWTIYTPVSHAPSLRVEYAHQGLSAAAFDDDGPIFSIDNSHLRPTFAHAEMWGQHYTNTKGLQHGVWEWDGSKYDDMTPSRTWSISDHPALGGMPAGAILRLYRTMVLEPNTICIERFYSMKPVGAR